MKTWLRFIIFEKTDFSPYFDNFLLQDMLVSEVERIFVTFHATLTTLMVRDVNQHMSVMTLQFWLAVTILSTPCMQCKVD